MGIGKILCVELCVQILPTLVGITAYIGNQLDDSGQRVGRTDLVGSGRIGIHAVEIAGTCRQQGQGKRTASDEFIEVFHNGSLFLEFDIHRETDGACGRQGSIFKRLGIVLA